MNIIKKSLLCCFLYITNCMCMQPEENIQAPAASDCISQNSNIEIIIIPSKRNSKSLQEVVTKRISAEYETRIFETMKEHVLENKEQSIKFVDFLSNELQKYYQKNKPSSSLIDRNYIAKKHLHHDVLDKASLEKYGSFLHAYWKTNHQENLTTEDIEAVNDACKKYYAMHAQETKKEIKEKSLKKLILCPFCWCIEKIVEDQSQ